VHGERFFIGGGWTVPFERPVGLGRSRTGDGLCGRGFFGMGGIGDHVIGKRQGLFVFRGQAFHATHAKCDPKHVPAAEREPEPNRVGCRANVMRGIRFEEKDRKQDFNDSQRQHDPPSAVAYDDSRHGLQQAIGEKKRTEDHRKHEVAVMIARHDQQRSERERAALHITQRALAAHANTRYGKGRETLGEQQPGEDVDGKIENAVEGIDENQYSAHQPDAAHHGQRAPTAAQVVHS
jgi:hypothetical protein